MIIPALALTLLAGNMVVTSDAQARGCPYSGGHGKYMSEMTDEQRSAVNKIMDDSAKVTTPIKEKMFVKKQELEALQNAATPDVSLVTKVSNELVELRRALREERDKLGAELDKALGLEPGTHKFSNYGHGGDGMGKGKGHGKGHGKEHGKGQM